jgi:hypothetical protein
MAVLAHVALTHAAPSEQRRKKMSIGDHELSLNFLP